MRAQLIFASLVLMAVSLAFACKSCKPEKATSDAGVAEVAASRDGGR